MVPKNVTLGNTNTSNISLKWTGLSPPPPQIIKTKLKTKPKVHSRIDDRGLINFEIKINFLSLAVLTHAIP